MKVLRFKDKTASEDSMDDDSSGSVMGYGNLCLVSEVSREIGNMSQDANSSFNYGKKLESDFSGNVQDHSAVNWIMNHETNTKLDNNGINDNAAIDGWLENTNDPRSLLEEEYISAEEDDKLSAEDEEKYSADDEDRLSTEEDLKYSEEFDSSSSNEGTKHNVDDDETKSSADDKISREGKVSANYLDDWLGPKSTLENELLPRKKLLWDNSTEGSFAQSDQWQSSSEEVEPSPTESEEDNEKGSGEDANSPPGSGEQSESLPTAKPVLCFDEYGNLTTSYQNLNKCQDDLETTTSKNLGPKSNDASLPFETSHATTNENCDPFASEDVVESSVCSYARTTRSRSKSNLESGENVLVSDQELKQAFKEEFMTAATSRYGRARKRKTVDGFFFGTINFNELRKITSSSPKKGKGSNSKNNSPDQKTKTLKDDAKHSLILGEEVKDMNENGITNLSDRGMNGENMQDLSLSTVQMDEAKEPNVIVQNNGVQEKEEDNLNFITQSRNHNGSLQDTLEPSSFHLHNSTENDTSSSEKISKNPNLSLPQEDISAKDQVTTESGVSVCESPFSQKANRRWRRSTLRKRGTSTDPAGDELPASVRPHRTSRSAKRLSALSQESTEVLPLKQPVSESSESNTVMVKVENTQDGSQEDFSSVTEAANLGASGPNTLEEKLSSITKSGRVIKKPQLMDISDEDKKQKLSREQQRQNEALMNSSLEEEFAQSPLTMQVLEKENPCKYMVGDLVWVHIRGSPLWPSMISYDPLLGQYSRVSLTQTWHKFRGIRMYHVQFFSDNAMTYWIAPSSVLPFEGYAKLKELLIDMKSKLKDMKKYKRMHTEGLLKTLMHMNKVSSGQKHERWIQAIEEAKIALEMDRYERIQKYTLAALDAEAERNNQKSVKLPSRNYKNTQDKTCLLEAKPEKRKRGRPRKSSIVNEVPVTKPVKSNGDSTDGEFSGFDDLSTAENNKTASLVSKLNKKGEFYTYAQKHLESFMLENPGITKESAMNKLRWRWKKLTNSQTVRCKSKYVTGEESAVNSSGKRKYRRAVDTEEGCEEDAPISTKRQRMEDSIDCVRGVYKVVRNEKVCFRCEGVSSKAGADMIRCKGLCCGVFHLSCLGLSTMPKRDFKCEECLTEQNPCFLCKSSVGVLHRCTVPFCGKFYHDECIQHWPQVSRQRQQEKFICPRHVCHMCAANADDIGDALARMPPFTRCLRCPTTYHTGEGCLAAGTEEVSQSNHICTKHLQLPKNISHHVNVNWCFCCSKGGSLLLCDQCPAAFHADCMKITAPEGGYVCEDCENGKFPVYGDVVWVKLGLYRWWPGQVLHPRFIPDNIENLPHQQGMFCVHFFGSNDYYWVTRGRAFLYQEGDRGSRAQSSKTLEMQFRRALDEALEAYRAQKAKKNLQEIRWSEKGNLKPPPYVRIDINRPVGNVRLSKLDLAAVNRCDCEPNSDNPCGSDEKCLNRMLMFECVREVCGAGERCGNQRFQKKKYPNVCCFRTEDRGWGLKTLQDVRKGEFVIEYVGELIDDEEFRRRIVEMHEVKEENYYFLTIDKDIMIDAGPKGNLARFMNHSCQPNCETQKWTVGGDTRVGLFAIEDIAAGSELTFNYNLQCVGTEKKRCCCGAPNCSGFIGVKVQKTETAGPKREKVSKQRRKRRRREAKLSEDECFRCGGPGDLILCDVVACPKGYHLECLGLEKLPRGKWICPWHHCDECGQRSTRLNRCNFCPNSFCRLHLAGNLQQIAGLGSVCQDHNPEDLETRSDGNNSSD